MSIMVLKAVFFPHSGSQFGDASELRDWLGYQLKVLRRGVYHMHNPSGLGDLEEGSIVFFHKDGFVVGSAIVEERLRKTTEVERRGYLRLYDEDFERVIKFVQESIWPWNDEQFLTNEEVKKLIGKEFQGQVHTVIDTLDQLLRLLQFAVAKPTISRS